MELPIPENEVKDFAVGEAPGLKDFFLSGQG
jgi:hypothetical protein